MHTCPLHGNVHVKMSSFVSASQNLAVVAENRHGPARPRTRSQFPPPLLSLILLIFILHISPASCAKYIYRTISFLCHNNTFFLTFRITIYRQILYSTNFLADMVIILFDCSCRELRLFDGRTNDSKIAISISY